MARISRRRSATARIPLLVLLGTAPAAAEEQALALASLDCARPSPGELAAAAELARAKGVLASTGALFAEGWTVGAAAGPRRIEVGDGELTETDLAFEASAPLLAGGGARERLAEALAAAEEVLPFAARLAARAEVVALYADAWAAERIEALRALSLTAADEWLGVARRRVAEGADAPYEAELVAVERREAVLALAAARAGRRAAWSTLAARCALPAEPAALDPPAASAEFGALGELSAAASFRVVALRAELERAAVGLETARGRSRWLLRGEAAQEGDEEVARLGFAYRFPRSGESAALVARRESELARISRQAEVETAALAARLEGALALTGSATGEPATADSIASIRTALDARLSEGRSRASEILPLRRQLLAAEISEIERTAALARAAAEIELLTAEVQP